MFYHASILFNWISEKELPSLNNLAIESDENIKEIVFNSFPRNKYNIKTIRLFQKSIPLYNNDFCSENEEIIELINNNSNIKKRIKSLPYFFEYENKLNFLEFNKKAFQSFRFDLILKIIKPSQFKNYQELWNYICEMKKYLTTNGLLVFSLESQNDNLKELNYDDFDKFLFFKKINLNKELTEKEGKTICVYLVQK